MDLVAYGTLVAAVVAAIAAVWSSVVSHRQLNLTRSTSATPMPVIAATMRAVEDQPDWTCVQIQLTNRADVPLTVLSASLQRPKAPLLSSEAATDPEDIYQSRLLNPLPIEKASDELLIGHGVRAIGSTRFDVRADLTYFSVYAHRVALKGKPPQLSVKLQWQDHEAAIFTMLVNVTKA
ncbi:hypothetical protein [Mesorhizobium australafricanum]|uniref:Uncharacterized protein n=1 Tax=Mesorhizobium australafricanum TaxID=3072311 RepID=A0ABU4WQP4_9HYPH|nr:hypothetical protein [Mesorhizobium sp. VK3E]MDX8438340.1 hypothetical protein [Mesorhizobium sp. VK3E]